MSKSFIKILLVEDDQLLSSTLGKVLGANHYMIDLAMDGQAGLNLATTIEYDLILLDVEIPKLGGISLCQQLRSQGYSKPILLLTANDSDADVVAGFDAGADDYISKPFATEVLLARIRTLLRRTKASFPGSSTQDLSAQTLTWGNLCLNLNSGRVTFGKQIIPLTTTEYNLLELFLQNPDRIFSRSAILDRFWGLNETPTDRAVITHIKDVRKKLKAGGLTEDIIETIYGMGYRLKPYLQSDTSQNNSSQEQQSLVKVQLAINNLLKKYRGVFDKQIAVLEQAKTALLAGKLDTELQQSAKHEAHKLAGSLATFGYPQGSELARIVELMLINDLPLTPEKITKFSQQVTALKQELRKPPITAIPSPVPAVSNYQVLVIDDDTALTERLNTESATRGFCINIVPNLQVARSHLARSIPDVILLDLSFPATEEDGLTLLQELAERSPNLPIIVFTGRDSLADRLAVSRLGARQFLHKPATTEQIFQALSRVLPKNQGLQAKVLIVDDDSGVLDHLSTLLTPWGLEITTLTEPQQFWEMLNTTSPNLVILDLEMPQISGLELCQVVRQDVQWGEAQQVIALGEIVVEITDRKRAEELLQQSELTLRSFFNSAAIPMGIVELHDGDILHISDNWASAQFFGHTTAAMENQFASALGIPPATIERWISYYQEAQRTQFPVRFEYLHITNDRECWLSGSVGPITISPSGYPRFSYIVEDISDRKHAEQTLELQATIARNMAEGICLIRVDNGLIVHANPKFEQIFGYDSGELNTQHVSILNYATESASAEDVNQAIRSAVLQRGELTYEVQNIKKDGTPFWCSATCSVFKHPDYGDILLAVHQDITERKQAEATLLQKSRQEKLLWRITQAIRQSLDLNAILNTTVTEVRQTLKTDRAAVYRFNLDWSGDFIIESVAEGWVKLVGQDIQKVWEDTYLQETQGSRFRNNESFVINDIYQAELQPCHIELLEQFQAKSYTIFPIFSGETLWGLLAIYQNTTSRHWQSWEVELLEQIASQLSIAIQQSELYTQLQRELQERKQAEATIREAERRWRSLLDNVQLIVVGLDQSGKVNYINPFFLKITGYTYSEVIGKNWFQNFLPPSLQIKVKTDFSEILNHNNYPYYQNAVLTKSGEERFIAWNNTLLQDSQGNIIGTISIGEDITERQRIEQIKDEFIGIVSHELRTPLTAIQMSLGLIKTGVYDQKPEKSRRMIEIALLDTNRLVNLVNDILDLERLESGRAVLEKTVCQAADLIQQAIEGIQMIATQQQITLTFTPTDAEVWGAADAIIQTLTNLLSNAIKFSPPQSTIHLSAERQTDFVRFQVRDQGRGIPADKLELIFGRFQQVDASDSREKGGTGLGLAICQSIIERHGGKIWAESRLGAGSTFFFTLPLPSESNL